MKHFNIKYFFTALAFTTALASCHKDKNVDPIPAAQRAGIYILNQGAFNASNSSLTYIDYDTKAITADKFNAVNNRGLGALGNDIEQYGSKTYIVMNVSQTLEVIDTKTAKSIKQIKFEASAASQPRYVLFNKGKAFVSLYDGTVAVIDTVSLSVSKYITVGRYPEQMAISNNKLYVANSGGVDGNYDNTVSVIDMDKLTETKKITVVENPDYMAANAYGDVYLISIGNYGEVGPALSVINSATDVVKSTVPVNPGYGYPLTIAGDKGYLITADGKIKVFDVKTGAAISDNFITDNTPITTPFSVAVDEITGEVFVTDANNYSGQGSVVVFNSSGTKLYTAPAGVIPGKILFVNK